MMSHKILPLFTILIALFYNGSFAGELPIVYRPMLMRAIAEERSDVVMLLAAAPDQYHKLYIKLSEMNIPVHYADYDVGYFRVRAPTDKVITISSLSEVQASALAATIAYLAEPDRNDGLTAVNNSHAKGAIPVAQYFEMAEKNKYYDWRESMGLRSLWEKRPNFDGRGTTVAIIEQFVDAAEPEFASAKNLNGADVRKVIGMYGFYNIQHNDMKVARYFDNNAIVVFSTVDVGANGSVWIDRKEIHLPEPGRYEIGFIEKKFAGISNLGSEDGGIHRRIAVARRPNSKCVWVDTNSNDKLTDEQCIWEYNYKSDSGFMRDEAGRNTGKRFFIVPTSQKNVVALSTILFHTHTISSAAVGNSRWGSGHGGTAPAAQLLSLSVGGRNDEVIEAMIFAGKVPQTDVILTMLGNMHGQNYGSNVYNIISDRIAVKYNKVMVTTAGNALRLPDSLNDISTGSKTISVAQFQDSYISSLFTGENINNRIDLYSSGGPGSDGALKPDVSAPSLPIVSSPVYNNVPLRSVTLACPRLIMPAALGCGEGTSHAAPAAAGAIASLISAARQYNLSFSQDDIRAAIFATARLVPGQPTYLQGRGVINIPAAIDYLRRLSLMKDHIPKLTVTAPMRTGRSELISVSGTGRGLYEVGGWYPGSHGKRHITITRESGGGGHYHLTLLGDIKNSFDVPSDVFLPLGKAVQLPISIHTLESGVHSAVLRLTDSKSGLVVDDISLVVLAALPLGEEAGYQASFRGTANGRTEMPFFFVEVPKNIVALKARGFPAKGYNLRLLGPTMSFVDVEGIEEGLDKNVQEGADIVELQRVVASPMAGVWTISVSPTANEPDKNDVINIQVTALSASAVSQQQTTFEKSAAPVRSGSQSAEAPFEQPSIWWRRVTGYLHTGQISRSVNDGPFIVPLDIPINTSRINVEAQIIASSTAEPIAVLITALQCEDTRCYPMDGAVSKRNANIALLRSPNRKWSSNWAFAFDVVGQTFGPMTIEYEIFTVPGASGSGMVISADGDMHIDDKFKFRCRENELAEYLELVSSQYVDPISGWKTTDKGWVGVEFGKFEVPLGRILKKCNASVSDGKYNFNYFK